MVSFSALFPSNVCQGPPSRQVYYFLQKGRVSYLFIIFLKKIVLLIIADQSVIARLKQIGVKFPASSCHTLPLAYD
jgi:hypothetical protein